MAPDGSRYKAERIYAGLATLRIDAKVSKGEADAYIAMIREANEDHFEDLHPPNSQLTKDPTHSTTDNAAEDAKNDVMEAETLALPCPAVFELGLSPTLTCGFSWRCFSLHAKWSGWANPFHGCGRAGGPQLGEYRFPPVCSTRAVA